MDFLQFASSHGLIVNAVYPSDKIWRCPTVTKPRKKNGAYWFDGLCGWILNWEDGNTQALWWKDENAHVTEADRERVRKLRMERQRKEAALHRQASEKAARMMREADEEEHYYLRHKAEGKAKQLAGQKALVLNHEMLVPMYHAITGELLGLQRIFVENNQWTKKFLYGSNTDLAVFAIGNGDKKILCEGYATGLSIKAACDNAGLPVSVIVCFTAGNILKVAAALKPDLIFADHDAPDPRKPDKEFGVGIDVAMRTGFPWTCSPIQGEDANDMHQRAGILRLQAVIVDKLSRPAI